MNLPLEIITGILLRLPAKTLLRYKIVCKLWYDLIKEPYFVKLHLERSLATKSNLHFVFKTPVLHLADFDTFNNPIELNYPYKSHDCSNGGVIITGSCRGLLCLQTPGFPHHVLIYNPTTQTYKRLPLLESSLPYSYYFSSFDYGFGYDSVSDDFKCVRIFNKVNDEMVPSSESEVMVYSLKDNVWRTAPTPPYDIGCFGGNVFLKDTIHWVFCHIADEELPLPIVTFNLRDESFSTLPLPNLVTADIFCMVVGILDGCLCLSVTYIRDFYVWVMKDYGMAGSWTLLYHLAKQDIFDEIRKPLCYSMNFNKLFVNIYFCELASINLETLDITVEKVGYFDKCTDAHLCVENLLMLEGRDDISDEEQLLKKKCRRNKR